MASAHVLEFTDANFDTEVLSSSTPVLVDFWAPWCQPCLMLAPVIDSVAAEFAGKIKVGKVDIDASPGKSATHQINSIPTLLLFKNGVEVKRWVGFTRREPLVAALNAAAGVAV